ncbi:MAG: N-acetyltransferase [Promethearchaeota archaeon]|nr:MAG: N-acetyltransferase [Candidatus Lokiarchaeota archaeon]
MFERAFFNFSVAVLLLPNDDVRRNKAHYFYVVSLRHMFKYGKAYANSPKIEGVVTWVHSDYKEVSTWQMIKFGALKAVYKLGAKNIKKAIDFIEFADKTQASVIEEPHYHLTWLAVEPKLQKKGIGTELMHAVLNQFSKENIKCFLDTQDKENVDYYKRFGFRLVIECHNEDLDVPFWGMLWEPET